MSCTESPDATADTELAGWVIAALERAQAGALTDAPVRVTAVLLEDLKRLAPSNELASQVGQVLLHFAAADAAFVFRPAWLDVARQVDDMVKCAVCDAFTARGSKACGKTGCPF